MLYGGDWRPPSQSRCLAHRGNRSLRCLGWHKIAHGLPVFYTHLALTPARVRSITLPMLIFKIFRSDEWAELRKNGATTGAPIDVADGYVHFSTAEQAPETAAKYFTDVDGLFLVAVDAKAAGSALKWEKSRGDALFPHLYRKMTLDDVIWALPLPIENGVHKFPAGLAEAST